MTEIVKVDEKTNPSFVVLRDNGDDAHYFYWSQEVTLPFPHQDVEPLKKKDKIFFSRYHYYGLTVWTDLYPGIDPTAIFQTNFHSPIMITDESSEARVFPLEDAPDINILKKHAYFGFRKVFEFSLEKKRKIPKSKGYSDFIVKEVGTPLEKFSKLFDKDYAKKFIIELVVIGKKESADKLISEIIKKDNDRLTNKAVCEYFF